MKNFFPTTVVLRRGLGLVPLALLLAAPLAAQAQTSGSVGIGTTAPDVSAALDIVSSSKGALLPRVADATAIATPATGLLVFQTGGTPGFYYNAGTPAAPSWQQLATGSGGAGATLTATNGLTRTGAALGLGGTLGQATTIDQAGNNFSLTGGNVGLGTTTPAAVLDIQGGVDNVTVPGDPVALAFQYAFGGGYRHFVRSRHDGIGALDFFLNTSTDPNGSTAPGTGNQHVLTMSTSSLGTRVGIGTTSPSQSAVLDIVSTNRGVLLPRVVDVTAIARPATGLLAYQTGGTPGFYYNTGNTTAPNWQQLATVAGAVSVQAGNGLTKTGATLGLGGALSGATDVATNGNNFTLSGTGNVGIGTSAPLARLHLSEGSALFAAAGDVPASATVPVSGAGRRLLWYADKAAFRVGYVNGAQWDDVNTGPYSFAAGYGTQAGGQSAVALGAGANASGERSFAFTGAASGLGSVAIGSGAQASGDEALAIGLSSASGLSSIASGLGSTTIGPSLASGLYATAIGLQNKATGVFSVAIGKNATSSHQGSVVIGDGCAGFLTDDVRSIRNNQLVMRGCGGINLYTSQNLSSGVELMPGGGSWSSLSDRRKKENFHPVDAEQLLRKVAALPITEWNYKTQPATQRHIGPMAQDFHAAFHLDGLQADTTINTLDIDGVNMVAIQALEKRTATLRQENELLRAQLRLVQAQVQARDEQVLTQLRALAEQLAALQAAPAGTRPEPKPAAMAAAK